MSKRGVVLALVAAGLLGTAPSLAAGKPVARPAATVARDWAQTVTMTPQGSYVLGNPQAKVRIVEYLSMTCTHCAHFTGESLKPLTDNYVRKGLVSVEVRHAIRDSLDVAATLLARCGGPKPFFGNVEALMAAQDDWVRNAVAFQEKDEGAAGKLPLNQALTAFAHGAGLDLIMAKRGLPAARANACLADKAEQDRLVAMAQEAWSTRQIPGTPAFLLNGTLVTGASSWATLEPKLKAAIG